MVALGAGVYMLHNTLQVHATQMAPEARGGALALFACSLFTGQSAGRVARLARGGRGGRAPGVRRRGARLFALSLDFRRRLARR